METHITTKENLLQRYKNEMHFLKTSLINLSVNNINYALRAEYYQECVLIDVNRIITLFKIPKNSQIYRHPDTIRVDGNVRYSIPNILNGFVVNGNMLLEGADGVGKTTISRELAYRGIITEDRNVPNISWLMEPQYTRNERIDTIEAYIENNPSKKIFIFINSNEEELLNRIVKRGMRSEYDKFALYKQEKYLDSYEELKKYSNLFLYDVAGKSINQIVKDIELYSEKMPKRLIKR